MSELSIPVALFAGLISFISPCVLPLVPPYLCYLAGTTFEQVIAREQTAVVARREVATSIMFVAGFSTVFVALGAGASAVGGLLRAYSEVLSVVAGLAILAMGLHFLGVFRLPFLHSTARMDVAKPVGLWGAYMMGLAFAFGWTPCIGPVLAAILAVAASEATVAKGAGLLAVYSLGLGIPFVLAAFAIGPFVRVLARTRDRLHLVEKIMGGLLVMTGIAFLMGWVTQASFWLLEAFPVLQSFG
jgi:cytochrome c-type biogenesis protein